MPAEVDKLPADDAGSLLRCWISIGSNLDREASVQGGVQRLRQSFGPLILSPVYETAAEGFNGSPFLNLVAGIETELAVGQIRAILRRIEDEHGRERRAERFAPRTLDLDLLTYGDRAGEIDGYRVPRDEILRYSFVLCPLADVAPDERHPTDGRSYAELWRQCLARLREERLTRSGTPPLQDSAGDAANDWTPLRRFELDLNLS